MGDIAQILAPTAAAVPGIGASSGDSLKAIEMAGMSKEAMYLLKGKQDASSASLPPIVPSFGKITMEKGTSADQDGPGVSGEKEQQEIKVKVGSKLISSSKRARPWTWAPFASSSRTDGAMFRHWVRKNVEYTDYPYAKFDIHMDPVTYTSEEYAAHLQSETWTRSETDRLMELARIFDCRWPVIFDRFCFESGDNLTSDKNNAGSTESSNKIDAPSIGAMSKRKIEDLQHRYYGVAAILAQIRIVQEAASEARALSTAAAKSAVATTIPKTPVTPTATVTSANIATKSTTGTPADPISAAEKQQENTENLLLESAAARSLATSAKNHQPLMSHVGTGTSNKMFDYEREQQRRHHLDRLWRRSKEEEEESQLRRELKAIDAQLRKLKKNGGHILAAGSTKIAGRTKATLSASRTPMVKSNGLSSQISSAPSSRGPSRSATPIHQGTMSSTAQTDHITTNDTKLNSSDILKNPDVLDENFASTAPVPMSQYPYLQSGRLVPPATGGSSGINKSLLTRMKEVLVELNIPERPLPTKRVCDTYDLVRKDILTLLTLKKMLMQKEGQLQSKRLRLSKMGGVTVSPEDKILDEERLLGIAPASKPSSAGTGSSSTTSKGKTVKRRSTASSGGKSKVSSKKGVTGTDTKNAASTTTKKKTVKRKRKADPSKSPTHASTNASSKSPAPGSTAAKAAKAKSALATTAGNAASRSGPKSGITTNPSALSNVQKRATGPNAVLPAGTPKAKSSTAATATVGVEKTNTGSASKRARKS